MEHHHRLLRLVKQYVKQITLSIFGRHCHSFPYRFVEFVLELYDASLFIKVSLIVSFVFLSFRFVGLLLCKFMIEFRVDLLVVLESLPITHVLNQMFHLPCPPAEGFLKQKQQTIKPHEEPQRNLVHCVH